jgi:glutaredoxin-related protein
MQVLVNPKEEVLRLANEMNDIQLLEIANFMQFIQLKNSNESFDLMKASESSLAFWDNEEDSVWDDV